MKTILTISALISIGLLLSFQTQDKPTNSELKTTCIVLAKLSNNAIDKNRKDVLAIYYNAYKALREENNFSDNCDSYFDKIKANHGSSFGTWKIQSEFPPKLLVSSGGGFTHKEIEFMEKLKNYRLFEKDFQDILLFMDIKRGVIKTDNIQNIDLNEWKSMIKTYNNLNLDKVEPKKIEELNKPSYNIKEFKQVIQKR
jgi:hypothetical protein